MVRRTSERFLPGGGYQLPGDCLIAGQARFDAEGFHRRGGGLAGDATKSLVLRSFQAVYLRPGNPRLPGRGGVVQDAAPRCQVEAAHGALLPSPASDTKAS